MCKGKIIPANLAPCPFCGGEAEIIKTKELLDVQIKNREMKAFFTVMYAACKECGATGNHFYPAFLPEDKAREEDVTKDIYISWLLPQHWIKNKDKYANAKRNACERTTNAQCERTNE